MIYETKPKEPFATYVRYSEPKIPEVCNCEKCAPTHDFWQGYFDSMYTKLTNTPLRK